MKLGDIFEDEFGGETPEDKSDSEAAAHMQSDRAQAQEDATAQKLKTIKILLKAKAFSKAEVMIAKLEKYEEERGDGCCENPEVYWCKVLLKYKASSGDELIKMAPDLENDEDFALAMGFSQTDEQLQYFTSITEEINKAKQRAAEEERLRKEEEERQRKIQEERERLRKAREEEEARQRKIHEEEERLRKEEEAKKAKTLKDCQINNGVLIKYYGNDSEIFIPDTVTSIGKDAFNKNKSLRNVTIPNSVTSIGSRAFRECYSLTSIIIPDSVTSIDKYAFSYCTSLTSVTIPNSVTSIGDSAFENCSTLRSVTIGSGVTSISRKTFNYCSQLKNITIPDSVTSIGSEAFCGCSSLTSITIPNSVTSIDRCAFNCCISLTSVTIPDSVTSIDDSAFYKCTSLKKAVFDGTWGWYKKRIDGCNWTSLNNYDLSNTSTAATYLTNKYANYNWERRKQ